MQFAGVSAAFDPIGAASSRACSVQVLFGRALLSLHQTACGSATISQRAFAAIGRSARNSARHALSGAPVRFGKRLEAAQPSEDGAGLWVEARSSPQDDQERPSSRGSV